jgi:hypothetical protein
MWYLIASIIILLAIFIWWIGRPAYRRNVRGEEFERFFQDFLSQMTDGSVVIVEHQGSLRFVQFAKHHKQQQQPILHFGFPDAPWSRQYFGPLVKMFQTNGIDFNIVSTGEDGVRRFLEIDLDKEDLKDTVASGANIARLAFESMGLDQSATFRIHFKGGISPEAARPSLELLRDAPNKLVRRVSRHYLDKMKAKKK